MPRQRIDPYAVQQTLSQLGPTFHTKDLSSHPLMTAAHPELESDPQYHTLVGRYLSSECAAVERVDGGSKKRGERWRTRLTTSESPVLPATPAATEALSAVPVSDALGPQYAGDDAFKARMRRHQSWYRASVLRLECGTGPSTASTSPYGNMLTRADGERGANFITPEIHEVALERIRSGGGAVEPFRLLHNMLSSQPMCFNLFGPLVHDPALATTLLQAIPEFGVARVLAVQLELAPAPRAEYLEDSTAFDAFVDYERLDGARAFIGFETKLTDTFSRKRYDTPAYRRWMLGARSPFRAGAETQVALEVHNQLWRDHLLAIAMRDHARSPYQHGTFVLLRHPEDRACAAIVRNYQELLTPGDATFIDLPMDRLVERWQGVTPDGPHREWLHAFHQRYLSLHESEAVR